MLKSYEAIYDHGKIKWLSELPDVEQARVIITVLPQQPLVNAETPKRRRPPEKLKGSVRVLGDIISSPFLAMNGKRCLSGQLNKSMAIQRHLNDHQAFIGKRRLSVSNF